MRAGPGFVAGAVSPLALEPHVAFPIMVGLPALTQLFGVRRPGAALVSGGLAPHLLRSIQNIKAVTTRVGPKRRQAVALEGVDSIVNSAQTPEGTRAIK